MAFLFMLAFCLLFEMIFHPLNARAAQMTYALDDHGQAVCDDNLHACAKATAKPPVIVTYPQQVMQQVQPVVLAPVATTTQDTQIKLLMQEIALLQQLLKQLSK